MHVWQKYLHYQERITNINRGLFSSLVFTTIRMAVPQSQIILKRLASRLSKHDHQSYSSMLSWLHCRSSLAFLRSCIMCLPGCLSSCHNPVQCNRQLAITEDLISSFEQRLQCLFLFTFQSTCLLVASGSGTGEKTFEFLVFVLFSTPGCPVCFSLLTTMWINGLDCIALD